MTELPAKRVDSLRRAALAGRSAEVIDHLRNLPEADRKALRRALVPELQAAISEIIEKPLGLLPGAELVQLPGALAGISAVLFQQFLPAKPEAVEERQARLTACRMAVVGLGNKSEVERALFSARMPHPWHDAQKPPAERFFYRAGLLLMDRPEPWRGAVLLRLCRPDQSWQVYATGRLDLGLHLLRSGALDEEDLLAAVARMARMANFHTLDWHDPLVLRLVWVALEARDEPTVAGAYPTGFTPSLLKAVGDGRIDRQRLINLALRRAAEASRPVETNWWVRLVEELAPTDAEHTVHREAALDLLGAPAARAVGLGVLAARRLLAAGAVAPDDLAPLLAAPLTSDTATAARGAVALLRRCAELAPAARVDALKTALAGLAHPKAAVPDAVLAWLESGDPWQGEPEVVFAARELLPTLPPAVAARLARLLPDEGLAPPAAEQRANAAGALPVAVRREVEERLQRERDPGMRAWLQACRAALDGGGPLPDLPGDEAPRWREAPPLALPETPEETARLMLKAGLGTEGEAALEPILFGIRLPLGEADPARLRRLLDPLLRAPAAPEAAMAFTLPGRLHPGLLRRLAAIWLGGEPAAGPAPQPFPLHLELRLVAAAAALARGERAGPLCTPTSSLGWLDTAGFAARVVERQRILPEERFELSAALYRLAPGLAERQAAWERIAPALERFDRPVRLALAAALAPDGEGDAAAERLADWVVETAPAPHPVSRAARRAVDFLGSLLADHAAPTGLPAPPAPVPSGDYTGLRLLTAAVRCRGGLGPSDLLRRVVEGRAGEAFPLLAGPGEGPPDLRRFLAHPEPVTPVLAATLRGGQPYANPWRYLFNVLEAPDRLFPELAPYLYPLSVTVLPEIVFDFPLGAPRVVEAALAQEYDRYSRYAIVPPLQLAQRVDVGLRGQLPAILRAAALDDRSVQEAAAQLVVIGLRDGRLRCADLLGAFPPALVNRGCRPRALVGILQQVANEGGAVREATSACLERAVASGLEALTGGERVVILEALLGWRAAAGRGIEDPEAAAALAELAKKGKSTRTGALARQLLELQPSVANLQPSQSLCAAHDVHAMLDRARPA
jgi:hypothetical protein